MAAWFAGSLTDTGRATVANHAASCDPCHALVEALIGAGGTDPTARATADTLPSGEAGAGPVVELRRGARVGRYVIGERLGAGGMGVVHAAVDTKLHRRVAVKLLRPDAQGQVGRDGAERLMREAQAMARLSHPNVVTVFDVGTHGGQLFVAMELVEGGSLSAWLRRASRGTEEITDRMIEAGRGLAAAHAAGFVHRDVKPDNILVGLDGRARVTDFGLVQLGDALAMPGDATSAAIVDAPGMATQTGTLVGTPMYMAPEQRSRGEADARTDQWSFCATLYEALAGVRPFVVDDLAERDAAIADGRLAATATGRRVPRWVRRIVLRGLRSDPAARWPSMDAVVNALARGRHRRRVALLGAGAVALAAIGLYVAVQPARAAAIAPRSTPCGGTGEQLAGIWDADARAALSANLLRVDRTSANGTVERVTSRLDAYAASWTGMRLATCEAAVRGELSPGLRDRRMRCLDRRRGELAAFTALYRGDAIGGTELDTAISGAAQLGDLEACARVSDGAPTMEPTDEATRARAEPLFRRYDELSARFRAGQYREIAEEVEALRVDVEAVEHPVLRALTLRLVAEVRDHADDTEGAVAALRAATLAAAAAHDDVELAADLTYQVSLLSGDQTQLDLADAAVASAEAALVRAGDPPRVRVQLLISTGELRRVQGKLPEARAALERASELARERFGAGDRQTLAAQGRLGTVLVHLGDNVAARATLEAVLAGEEAMYGPEHPVVASRLDVLGAVLDQLGLFAEALPMHERALALTEATYGPDHPALVSVLNNTGQALRGLGRRDEAIALYRRGLAIREHAYGPDDPRVAKSLNYVGNILAEEHRFADAAEVFRRVLTIRDAASGPEHPETGLAAHNLGFALLELGRRAEARPLLERALRILQTALGDGHPDVAMALTGLGRADLADKRFASALDLCGRALAIDEAALGADHPVVAADLVCLGLAHLGLGHRVGARATLERAVAIDEASHAPPADLAASRAALARANR